MTSEMTFPVNIKDLPSTPEIEGIIKDRYIKNRSINTAGLEEMLKLQHYFGGQSVLVEHAAEDSIILAAGNMDSPEFRTALDQLKGRHYTIHTPNSLSKQPARQPE